MSPMEGRSLLRGAVVLLTLALLRIGIDRIWTDEAVLPDADTDLQALLEDSRAVGEEEGRRSAPLAPDEKLDPNRSGEDQLDRLPGIGPATAKAMVADREENGGFTRPEDLLRVTGIGPATLSKIRPFLDFSRGVPLEFHRPGSSKVRREVGRGGFADGIQTGVADSVSLPRTRIDLNRGSFEDLQSLPGIGPALARRILDSRLQEGPFRRPDDLLRVRGIGPAILARVRNLVTPAG